MTVRSKLALACAALLFGAANGLAVGAPDNASSESRYTSTMASVSQPYANQTYGFVVPSVAGARAYQDKPPNPNHGVVWCSASDAP